MRFEEIPKYIKAGTYRVDVAFMHLEDYFQHWNESWGIELEPDFQRAHVWTKAQRTAYMEFLIKGGQSSKTLQWNCPSIHHLNRDGDLDNKLVLVDGLQRITAVRMFLDNKVKVFGHYLKEYDDAESFLSDICQFRFHMEVNDLNKRADLLLWYLQLNEGGTVHSKSELARVHELYEKEVARHIS